MVLFLLYIFLNFNAVVVLPSNSLIAHAAYTQCAAPIAKSLKKLTVCSIRLLGKKRGLVEKVEREKIDIS